MMNYPETPSAKTGSPFLISPLFAIPSHRWLRLHPSRLGKIQSSLASALAAPSVPDNSVVGHSHFLYTFP